MAEPQDPRLAPDVAAALDALDDMLLGGPRDLTVVDVAERAGIAEEEVRVFWQALGLHLPEPGERGLTASDAEMIGSYVAASREFDLRTEAGVSLVRAMGHSVERLVAWQSETIVEHLQERYGAGDVGARALLLQRMPVIWPLLERGLVHAWRRHVTETARRGVAGAAEGPQDDDELPLARAVGLADVVGFTTRTATLGASALAEYVQGFESRARNVVTELGGRVVKTVGDAVLFVADDAVTGAEVALGLVRALGPDTDAPLRAGLVWGRVLSRFGDIFGPAVSLASRLCDEAGPGRVLVDEVTAVDLSGRFLLEPLEPREVAGIGALRPSLLIAEV